MVDHRRLRRSARALGFCALAAACVWSCATRRWLRSPAPIAWRDCGDGAPVRGAARPARPRSACGSRARARAAARPGGEAGRAHRRPVREPRRAGSLGGRRTCAASFGALLRRALRERFDLVAVRSRAAPARARRSTATSQLGATCSGLRRPTQPTPPRGRRSSTRAARSPRSARASTASSCRSSARPRARATSTGCARRSARRRSRTSASRTGPRSARPTRLSYPERVRALVLDGSIDPSFDLALFAREQAIAVEAGARPRTTPRRSTRAGTASSRSTRPTRARPQKSTVLYGAAEGLSSPPEGWRDLALALGAAEEGEAGRLRRARRPLLRRANSDGTRALAVEAQLATLCADTHRPKDADAYRAALPEFARGLAALRPREPAERTCRARSGPSPRARSAHPARPTCRRSWSSPTTATRSRRTSGASDSPRVSRAPCGSTSRAAPTPPTRATAPASTSSWTLTSSRRPRPRARAVPSRARARSRRSP